MWDKTSLLPKVAARQKAPPLPSGNSCFVIGYFNRQILLGID